jgi:hypothetical protein
MSPSPSLPSSLLSFWIKCCGPLSLSYIVAGHAINMIDVISQDYKSLGYNNGAPKHRIARGVQTSLNTKPKPRAKRQDVGIILSTSQSTTLIN